MFRFPALLTLFFFNDTATTEIYTLSLHDALPISRRVPRRCTWCCRRRAAPGRRCRRSEEHTSELSHVEISYAVFCLKKKMRRFIYPVAVYPTAPVNRHLDQESLLCRLS